jgi:hypothetical protein
MFLGERSSDNQWRIGVIWLNKTFGFSAKPIKLTILAKGIANNATGDIRISWMSPDLNPRRALTISRYSKYCKQRSGF